MLALAKITLDVTLIPEGQNAFTFTLTDYGQLMLNKKKVLTLYKYSVPEAGPSLIVALLETQQGNGIMVTEGDLPDLGLHPA